MAVIRITHGMWERLGSHSLSGLYANAITDGQLEGDLILEIEQTSRYYRSQNNGPALMVVPEFLPPCVLEDVLTLDRAGIKVSIEIVEVDFPKES